jgi:exopolysaccharide production protein ExoZ
MDAVANEIKARGLTGSTEIPASVEQAGAPLRRIFTVQYLRAFAAISVLFYHASFFVGQTTGDNYFSAIFNGRFGVYGVALFFAISGYLMAELAQRTDAATFLAHRVMRLYPIFWILTLGKSVLFGTKAGVFFFFNLSALALMPMGEIIYPLGIEWTLVFEIIFYLMVAALMVIGAARYIHVFGALWLVAILARMYFLPDVYSSNLPTLIYLPLSPKSIPFPIGLMVPFVIRMGWVGRATPAVIVVLLLLSESITGFAPLAYGLSSGCLVALAALPDRQPDPFKPGLALGNWSYALYLCHVTVIQLVIVVLAPKLSATAVWSIAIAASLVAMVLAGMLDVRLYQFLKSRLDRSGPLPKRMLAGALIVVAAILAVGTEVRGIVESIHEERLAKEAGALRGRLHSIEPASASLIGHVDELAVKDGILTFGGWVLNKDGYFDPPELLLFYGNEYIVSTRPREIRSDVLKVFGLRWLPVTPGYRSTVAAKCVQGGEFILIARLSPDNYRRLESPATPRGC